MKTAVCRLAANVPAVSAVFRLIVVSSQARAQFQQRQAVVRHPQRFTPASPSFVSHWKANLPRISRSMVLQVGAAPMFQKRRSLGVLHARMRQVEDEVFRAKYSGEINPEGTDARDIPDYHVGAPPT